MKKFRNIMAMLMVFVMLVAVMPMNVFAGDADTPVVDEKQDEKQDEIKDVKIKSDITGELKVGDAIPNPKLTVEGENATVTFGKWYKGDEEASGKFKEGKYTYTFTIAPKGNAQFADNLTVTLNGAAVTATETANVYKSSEFTVKKPEVKKFKLTTKVEGEGGKVDPEATEKEYDKDKKVTVEFIPDTGHELDEVKVNDVKTTEVKDNKLEITMDADKTVVVKFKKTVTEEEKALEEAKKAALAELEKLNNLTPKEKEAAEKDIKGAKNKTELEAALKAAKTKNDAKKPNTPVKTVKVVTIGNGTASVNNEYATKGQTVTVTAKPYSGYAVARVYLKYNDITKNINTYYNGYYYDGRYYGRYNDYYKYLNKYENNSYYLRKYDSYREFLRYEYPSHYRYYEDYDYWTDRYDYDWYNRYDNYYYKYLDDYNRYYSDRYATYEDYLKVYHYPHYRDYYNYRYDYNWYNRYGYNTSDTFEMPASDVTVYVEFTDAYPYYYDDYYYYRYHRDKKDNYYERQKKAEEKAEEEKVVEKTPQVFEASATINIGSNVFTKVNKNVTTTHQMDVAAYVKNGRVMLPLRYVAEALGLQVSWVPETKTVIIWDLTQRVEIPIKSNKIIVNGVTYTSDVKPEIKNSRTMLPIANIARALGLVDGSDIIWDPVLKQVKLTRRVISK